MNNEQNQTKSKYSLKGDGGGMSLRKGQDWRGGEGVGLVRRGGRGQAAGLDEMMGGGGKGRRGPCWKRRWGG